MRRAARAIYDKVINPPVDEKIQGTVQADASPLPTLWLIGKTGAGKSSIVQRLTGDSAAEIGNGFRPCTPASYEYLFPQHHSILRFVDTRGLGESSYDPDEDIASLARTSHALLIVIRLRDPEQSAVLSALKAIKKAGHGDMFEHALIVLTGAREAPTEHEFKRLEDFQYRSIKEALGKSLPSCHVDFAIGPDGGLGSHGEDSLRDQIAEMLPRLRLFLASVSHSNQEIMAFQRVKSDILWYATAAAATDAIPAAGLVTVPAIQGKMLHSLGQQYGIEWDRQNFAGFAGALGSSFGMAYASSLAGRQLAKLVPAWGQVVGAALAASISFATTFALGRAACYYLHHTLKGDELDSEELRALYRDTLKRAREQARETAQESGN